MRVLELDASRSPQDAVWDSFVRSQNGGGLYQLAGWRHIYADVFGIRPHFLYAEDGGEIRGIMPLLYVRGLLGAHLTSMPGGILVDGDDAEIAGALLDEAKARAQAYKVRYLTLRDSPIRWELPELVTQDAHCTFIVALSSDPDKLMSQIDRAARRSIRKAFESRVEVLNGPEYLDTYYPVYAAAMREVGTPTLGRAFFERVFAEFPPDSPSGATFTVQMVQHLDHASGAYRVLGGGFVAWYKDTSYATWAGLLREHYELQPGYLLYYEMLKIASERGLRWADLGRSLADKDQEGGNNHKGSNRFKLHWKPEVRPLYQQFYLSGAEKAPAVGGSREDQALYRLFVSAWQRVPLFLTERIGPWLRKQIPFG